jgi:DNA processing protein
MVFAIPGHIYSEHHQGCHQLIREGAILVDHPEQIIEDLALPTQWQSNNKFN